MKLGYLPQELSAEDAEKTVYDYLAEEGQLFLLTAKRVVSAFRKTWGVRGTFLTQIRSGNAVRRGKGKNTACETFDGTAGCVFSREPSNDLDLDAIAWLEQFIQELKCPVMYISHDEMLIEHTANVIIHFEQLRKKTVPVYTVARMSYRKYCLDREQRFAHQMQIARKERCDHQKPNGAISADL